MFAMLLLFFLFSLPSWLSDGGLFDYYLGYFGGLLFGGFYLLSQMADKKKRFIPSGPRPQQSYFLFICVLLCLVVYVPVPSQAEQELLRDDGTVSNATAVPSESALLDRI